MLHQLCLNPLFLFAQTSLPLYMSTKNNSDSTCSLLSYAFEDSRDHNPPDCVSCANHLLNDSTTGPPVEALRQNHGTIKEHIEAVGSNANNVC